MIWISVGVLLALIVRNGFDTQGMAKDVRSIVRVLRKTIKDISRAARHALKENQRRTRETKNTDPEK